MSTCTTTTTTTSKQSTEIVSDRYHYNYLYVVIVILVVVVGPQVGQGYGSAMLVENMDMDRGLGLSVLACGQGRQWASGATDPYEYGRKPLSECVCWASIPYPCTSQCPWPLGPKGGGWRANAPHRLTNTSFEPSPARSHRFRPPKNTFRTPSVLLPLPQPLGLESQSWHQCQP